MTINVYERYYVAEAEFNGVPRHGALVMLVADSDAGNIKYEAAVTFSRTTMRKILPFHTTLTSAKCCMRPRAVVPRNVSNP